MKINKENVFDLVGMTFYDGTISATIDNAELSNYGDIYDFLEIHTKYGWSSIQLELCGYLPEPWAVYQTDGADYLSCIELKRKI